MKTNGNYQNCMKSTKITKYPQVEQMQDEDQSDRHIEARDLEDTRA